MSEVVPMLDAAGKDLFLVRVVGHTSIHFVNICWCSDQVLGIPCQRQIFSVAILSPHLHGTKYNGQVVSTPASYLIIPRYISRPGDQLSRLRFPVVFLTPSRYMPR
jgi:hypothetical protein